MGGYELVADLTVEELCAVFEDSVRNTCLGDYTLLQVEAWVNRSDKERWKSLLAGDLCFIGVRDRTTRELVGFTSVNNKGYLHSMFVRQRYQRKGVASLLLHTVEEFAVKHGASALRAEVSLTAFPFFKARCFAVISRQTVMVNQVDLDNYLMCKPLIVKLSEKDYDVLFHLWEESVRSTHHFLSEGDITFYASQVKAAFLHVELYGIRNSLGKIVAFMGLSEKVIEMLFVHPKIQGKGYGSRLIDYAVQQKGIHLIDVNEQNSYALQVYLHKGFRVVDRDELDSTGRPFPILHMEWGEN